MNFTRNGLRLGSRHQEHHAQTCQVICLQLSSEAVLPGLRRRTELLPSGPKSSFQMRASFVFHLETKVLESRGRVEKLIAQVAWSPLLSFHSLLCYDLGCNVICWWWSIVFFFLNQHHCTRLPIHFGALHAFLLLFYSIFQQDLAPAHTAKSTKSWLNDHGFGVLDWPANSPDLNPRENIWGIVKRKMRNKRPKNTDELKATVKETWASIPPQQCHKLITSTATPNWGSN